MCTDTIHVYLMHYRFIRITYTGCLPWQKLMQKIAILTRAC